MAVSNHYKVVIVLVLVFGPLRFAKLRPFGTFCIFFVWDQGLMDMSVSPGIPVNALPRSCALALSSRVATSPDSIAGTTEAT